MPKSKADRVFYYLSRFVGSGTEADPFRPEVASAAVDWSAIDLRGDACRVAGHCIAAVDTRPTPDPAGAVNLGTDMDAALKPATLTEIEQALGVTLDAENTVREIATALLTKYADAASAAKPDPLCGDSITLGATTWAV